ncbi:hypothetical protein ATANTOWER_018067 [Ataeniobius toweri]|uniref:Uncharacterized protein n=1 Tax=Ataeniobius toweri TaxID=208326 RepID=A0ABU7AQD4_9TELE|nr:hypothetical protein [Ataeniobius toweri]
MWSLFSSSKGSACEWGSKGSVTRPPLVLCHDVCLDGLYWNSNFPSGINKVSLYCIVECIQGCTLSAEDILKNLWFSSGINYRLVPAFGAALILQGTDSTRCQRHS